MAHTVGRMSALRDIPTAALVGLMAPSDTVPAATAPTPALIARMTRWHAAGADQRTSP